LTKATDEAKAERQRLLDEARKAADALSAKRQESLQRRAESKPSHQSFDAKGSVCHHAQGADGSRHGESGRTDGRSFHRRLREMNGNAKAASAKRSRKIPNRRLFAARLTCPRSNARRSKMRSTKPFRRKFHLRFETAPDLVSGIELTTNGQKVAGASRITLPRWKRASANF
jgi:F-type H+-transporting ATPase subunit b